MNSQVLSAVGSGEKVILAAAQPPSPSHPPPHLSQGQQLGSPDFGQPKIHDPSLSLSGHHNIGTFNIPVDDPLFVGFIQSMGLRMVRVYEIGASFVG